jgi:hypothetical protein
VNGNRRGRVLNRRVPDHLLAQRQVPIIPRVSLGLALPCQTLRAPLCRREAVLGVDLPFSRTPDHASFSRPAFPSSQWGRKGHFQYVCCHPVTTNRVLVRYADDGRGGRGRTCPLPPYEASAVR